MAQEDLCQLESTVARRCDMQLISSLREADLLTAIADRVICMGGYNSATAVVSFNKPALIVPRISPRQEQFIRAERFAQLGLVDMLHPSDLSPASLTAWLAQPTRQVNGKSRVSIDGLNKISQYATDLLAGPAQSMISPPEYLEAF
jgi:predicted glycosyltransferase